MNREEKSYGEWFEQLADWEWYATFTFRFPTPPRTANHLWRKHWLRLLEREVNGQVHFIRVLEEGDNTHYHCLLSGIGDENPSSWERVWHKVGGIAKIDRYIPGGGAAEYIGGKCARGCDWAWSKKPMNTPLFV